MGTTWSLQGNPGFSFKLLCVIGAGAKLTAVQACYTRGGSGYFCWKSNSAKLISPDLLVLALFSETASFMVSADDD